MEGIRRSTASTEPTITSTSESTSTSTSTSTLPSRSGSQAETSAPRRGRKSKRSPRGLGRGLGRILTDSGKDGGPTAGRRPGLLQLVGADVASGSSNRIRDLVIDAALGALADGFGLQAVVLGDQCSLSDAPSIESGLGEDDAAPAEVSAEMFLGAKLPTGCKADSELFVQILAGLAHMTQNAEDTLQTSVGGYQLLACRLYGDGALPVVAVAVREAVFQREEEAALTVLLSALVACCTDDGQRSVDRSSIAAGTAVSLKSDGAETLAEVTAGWAADPKSSSGRSSNKRRFGAARDVDPIIAVAKAAAKASRPRCDVIFAGSSAVDEFEASVVLVDHPDRGLRFGYSVHPVGDLVGPAEAVFTAALA